MALSVDGHASAISSGSSSLGITLSTATAGDIIVVAVYAEVVSGSISVSNVTALGLVFAKRAATQFTTTNLEYWWAFASGTLSSLVITINFSGASDDAAGYAFGVTGFTGTDYQTSPWDPNASLGQASSNTSSGSAVITTNSFSTTKAATMLLAFAGHNTGIGPTTFNSPATDLAGSPVNNSGGTNFATVAIGNNVVAVVQTGITITAASNANWICFADALAMIGNPASSGGGLMPQALL